MILQNIDRLIQITEDNIFVQAKNYGIYGVFNNWLTKLFSSDVTESFDKLISSIDTTSEDFNNKKIISKKDTEEYLNRAINKCRNENNGRCIVNLFFDTINNAIFLIIDEYIDILAKKKIDLHRISTFSKLAALDNPELEPYSKVFSNIYNSYISSIDSDNYNKFFFKLRGSVIDSGFIKEKTNAIDNYINAVINNYYGTRTNSAYK